MVARRAHNPKVVGSNPAPATKFESLEHVFVRGFFIKPLKMLALLLSAITQEHNTRQQM